VISRVVANELREGKERARERDRQGASRRERRRGMRRRKGRDMKKWHLVRREERGERREERV
jgi:hypothetical protein